MRLSCLFRSLLVQGYLGLACSLQQMVPCDVCLPESLPANAIGIASS